MITTPTNTASTSASTPQMPQVSDEFLMMAAAQMHSEGRLVIPSTDSPIPPKPSESK
jgi:hypothetical protein